MSSSILLTNATILVPSGEGKDYVHPLRQHSLLIEGNKISQIAPEIIPLASDTQVVDCTGKIISPGFIDTHHHMWQTQLKGRHADQTLLEYMPTGRIKRCCFARLHTEHCRKLPASQLHTRGYILGTTGRLSGSPRCGDYNGRGPCPYERLTCSLYV